MSLVARNTVSSASLLVLSACTQPEPVFPVMTFNKTAAFNESSYTQDHTIDVSAWNNFNDKYNYLTAECVISGAGFKTKFTTPAKVLIPVFGSSYQSVELECAYGGIAEKREFETEDETLGTIRVLMLRMSDQSCSYLRELWELCYFEEDRQDALGRLAELKALPLSEHQFSYLDARLNFLFTPPKLRHGQYLQAQSEK